MTDPGGNTTWRWWRLDGAALGVCALFTLVGYVVAFQPVLDARRQRSALRAQLAALHSEAAQADAKLAKLRSELTTTQRTVADSPLRLYSVSQINQRLAGLTELADRSGLAVDQVQPGRPVKGERFDVVPIRITGEGAYPTCVRFIHQLHREHNDTGVRAFTLTGKPGAPDAPASFQCDLVWYAAPDDSSPRHGW